MSTTGSQRCYVLLMRHAVPTTEGCADLEAVSRRLSETLRDLKRLPDHYHIKLKVLLHGKSTLASETAEVIATHFTETEAFSAIEPHEVFDGLHASPYSGDSFADELREAREAIGKHLAKAVEAEGNALLVVGHQPLIGILATQGIGDARSGWFQSTVPLAKSEVACFAVDRKGADGAIASCRLLWTISPSDDVAMEQLREKVAAKMTVASVIGSVCAAALVLILDGILASAPSLASQSSKLRYGAALCLFVAAWLYLATVVFCDRLLMPPRFWGEANEPANLNRRPNWLVWRPPASATWVIYQNMLRVWRWFFVPATALATLGMVLLGVALFRPADISDTLIWLVLLSAVLGGLQWYCFWRRPRLGVED